MTTIDRSSPRRGHRLPRSIRTQLESLLQISLSGVHLETGSTAEAVCRPRGATAAASGETVYWSDAAPELDSPDGIWVLAHEVAHIAQQRLGMATELSSTRDRTALESMADAVADRASLGIPSAFPAQTERPNLAPTGAVTQFHGSWEHRMLGDAPPGTLAEIASHAGNRGELLQSWKTLLGLWEKDPATVTEAEIRQALPGVRTLTLANSGLVITYGELNSLPDFFANPTSIMEMPASIMLPIVQTVRQEGYNKVNKMLSSVSLPVSFADSTISAWWYESSLLAIWRETEGAETLTRNLGINGSDHYKGVLARNACHFVPFTWRRFQAFNTLARQHATAAHNDPANRDQNTQLAWQYAGYADHFLQDSFAAGHLINKTLAMQWFIEAMETSKVPVDNWDVIKAFTTAAQPGLAGSDLYDLSHNIPSNDPQTVEEYPTYAERLAAVRLANPNDESYQAYLAFLGSMAAQLASGLVHDYFNKTSVYVASVAQPNAYQLWGDDTMLNGADGSGAAQGAAQNSQQAIQELIDSGETSISQQNLLDSLPSQVASVSGQPLQPIAQWAKGIEAASKTNIFSSLRSAGAWGIAPAISGVSQDMAGKPAGGEEWRTVLSTWPAWNNGYGRYVSPRVVGDQLYATTPGYVWQLAPDGKNLGYNVLRGYGYMDVRLTGDHEHLYFGTDGYLGAISLQNLQQIDWWAPLSGSGYTAMVNSILVDMPNSPEGSQSTPFVGHNGSVYQVNPLNGQDAQALGLGWGAYEVLIASDDTSLLVGCNGAVTMLDVTNINARWHDWPARVLVAGTEVPGRTNVLCEAGMVYASVGPHLTKFAAFSGDPVGRWTINGATELRLLTDGVHVFAAAPGGIVQGWNDATGASVIDINLSMTAQAPTTMCMANGLLYVACAGRLIAIDVASKKTVYDQVIDRLYDPAGPPAEQEIRMDTDGVSLYLGANLLVVAITLL